MRFDIQPFRGILPITFGMYRDEVRERLGPPGYSRKLSHIDGYGEGYPAHGCNIGYDASWRVNEVVVHAVADELTIEGRPIWVGGDKPDPNHALLALDAEPVEYVGNWFFRDLARIIHHGSNDRQRKLL